VAGTEHQSKYSLGGHLDSWDLGDSSHDDGAGCVQSMEVLNIFKNVGINKAYITKLFLFMNENGVKAVRNMKFNLVKTRKILIFALESGFPRGFSIDADELILSN
jgi:hypothetical protein